MIDCFAYFGEDISKTDVSVDATETSWSVSAGSEFIEQVLGIIELCPDDEELLEVELDEQELLLLEVEILDRDKMFVSEDIPFLLVDVPFLG